MWKGILPPIGNSQFRHLRRDEAVDLARRIRDGTGPAAFLRDPCELPNKAHYTAHEVARFLGTNDIDDARDCRVASM